MALSRSFTTLISLLAISALLWAGPAKAQNAAPELDQAGQLLSQGRAAEAVAPLGQYLAANPDDGQALLLRARVFAALSEWGRARADLDRLLELKPLDEKGLFLRARAALNQGVPGQALADLDQLLSLEPDLQPAWALRASARGLAGDRAGRIADLNKALELDPKDIQSLLARGQAHQAAGEGAKALADFAEAIKTRPDLARAYFLRSTLFADQDQPTLALADAQMAVQLAPDDKTAVAWLARLEGRDTSSKEEGKDGDKADKPDAETGTIETLSAQLEEKPEEAGLYLKRGRIYTERGMFGLARADLDMARMLDADPKKVKAAFEALAKAEAAPPKTDKPEVKTPASLEDDPELVVEP